MMLPPVNPYAVGMLPYIKRMQIYSIIADLINMFKATFDIRPENVPAEEFMSSLLLMEVSSKAFSYVIYNKTQQRFHGFRQYSLDYNPGKTNLETFREILEQDELLQNNFRE